MWMEKSPRTEPGLDFACKWKKDVQIQIITCGWLQTLINGSQVNNSVANRIERIVKYLTFKMS